MRDVRDDMCAIDHFKRVMLQGICKNSGVRARPALDPVVARTAADYIVTVTAADEVVQFISHPSKVAATGKGEVFDIRRQSEYG